MQAMEQLIQCKFFPVENFFWSTLFLNTLERREIPQRLFDKCSHNPANTRLHEDVLKTSFVFVFRRRLQDVLIKTNMFALALRLQKTSWSRPIYSSWPYVFKTSSRRLQDVSKTSSTRLQHVFKTSCKDIFKTFSRRTIKLICSS